MPSSSPDHVLITRHRALWPLALMGVVWLSACGKADPASAPVAPPLPQVGVVTVALGDVALLTELPGRLESSRVAQVRARAAGIVQKRWFTEGGAVRAGQRLFSIDPAPLKAAFDSAQASLARAQANLTQATALAERYAPLAEANAVSQQEYANAVAAQKQAQADVAVANAAVQAARINLDHATVVSPIAGRIGRALVTEGALVGQGEATPLAVVQQMDPLYVNFTQSAAEVMRLRKALEAGQLRRASGSAAAAVAIVLEDGTLYGQSGKLLFSDMSVDPSTGQITLRAEVPNPKGELLPGLYVRVRVSQAEARNAITLPQQAVARAPSGDTVTVVAPDGQLVPRPVKVGDAQDGRWVILSGLQAGEQVMVDGFQKVRGTGPVKPVPWQPSGATAAVPASAPTAAVATKAGGSVSSTAPSTSSASR